jgi:hypothetical protein
MTYSEIYIILFFKKTKINYEKIIMSTKNNLIIVIGSAKSHGAQIIGVRLNIMTCMMYPSSQYIITKGDASSRVNIVHLLLRALPYTQNQTMVSK